MEPQNVLAGVHRLRGGDSEDTEVRELVEAAVTGFVGLLAGVIENRRATGVMPASPDGRALAQALIGMNRVAAERDARAVAASQPADERLLAVLGEIWHRALVGSEA